MLHLGVERLGVLGVHDDAVEAGEADVAPLLQLRPVLSPVL